MSFKTSLIYNDLLTACMLGFVVFRWNHELRSFWILMFVYFFVKQIIKHKEYYKLNKKLF
jgi:hypothetical protein